MNAETRFTAYEAAKARAEAPVPLLVGLTGPSGSGKTFSALRIASGIREVVGGEIFVIDTEQRRALHYADRFQFKHVNFAAPFGSLDYLDALRFAKDQGAGVVVIDSCSHEHDGPGGLLEQHEAELTRMAGTDYKKRERMTMLAWQKPKAGRRKLINAITTELAMPVIFCFRAKTTAKPMKNDQGRIEPVDMGFTTIGADEWLFEMALNALLLPGSDGFPTWHSDKPGERLAIKLPEQFRGLADRNRQLDEKVGEHLAKWASGTLGKGAAKQKIEDAPRQFAAEPVGGEAERFAGEYEGEASSGDTGPAAAKADMLIAAIGDALNTEALAALEAEFQTHREALGDEAARVDSAIVTARRALERKAG